MLRQVILSMISYWLMRIVKYPLSSLSVTNTYIITDNNQHYGIIRGSHDHEYQWLVYSLGGACPDVNNAVHLESVSYNIS